MTTNIGAGIGAGLANHAWASNNAAVQAASPFNYEWLSPDSTRFEVQRANNGFILRTARMEGGRVVVHIAATIEELRDLITTELVTQKMEVR